MSNKKWTDQFQNILSDLYKKNGLDVEGIEIITKFLEHYEQIEDKKIINTILKSVIVLSEQRKLINEFYKFRTSEKS